MELRLVENLQKRSTAFQLQDLRCQKCHRVAKKQMGLYCPCSGNLACDDTPEVGIDFNYLFPFMPSLSTVHRRVASREDACKELMRTFRSLLQEPIILKHVSLCFLNCPCFCTNTMLRPPQAFAKYLRTLTNIAKFHSFDWLREVAESLAR